MSAEGMSTIEIEHKAGQAAKRYLDEAIEAVEEKFGQGTAGQYPAIIAALIQASAAEYMAGIMDHRIAPNLDHIADAIERRE